VVEGRPALARVFSDDPRSLDIHGRGGRPCGNANVTVTNQVDIAIEAFTRDKRPEMLRALEVAFLGNKLFVPIGAPASQLDTHKYDVPALCVRNAEGQGALPCFTDMRHLNNWKPTGCRYVSLLGRAIIAMAVGMNEVEGVVANPGQAPRGWIPRTDFSRMLTLP
jgi:hypothetical protein